MPTDAVTDGSPALGTSGVDAGLLSPVSVGHDGLVTDGAVCEALVTAEAALARAWAALGVAPPEAADDVSSSLGWLDRGAPCDLTAVAGGVPLGELIKGSVAGGNPVIPLVGILRDRVPETARAWVHRGATSQDILDSALMFTASRAGWKVLDALDRTIASLSDFALDHGDETAAARTLTQHAVPTTVGLRASGWLRGVRRARSRLASVVVELPAQLAGAGGTLASFVEIASRTASPVPDSGGRGAADIAGRLPAAFAHELGLATPEGPWHTERWPVTELGDALVQSVDALGKMAADVTTLSRTEIGELAEGTGGGSSAMPQKQNPARSVLIRSAAIRAPYLAATLHAASALAVDERPDGAWHAEWPALRELLRVALGASAHAVEVAAGLRVNAAAASRNLALTRGLIVAERLNLVLGPVLGAARVKQIVTEAGAGADLAELLRAEPALEEAGIDVDALVDPARYTGLAARIVAETCGGSGDTD